MADYTADQMANFFATLGRNAFNFKGELQVWLRAWCEEFLDDVVSEIEKRQVIDTGILKESFQKGDTLNVWIETDSGLTIEVGSMVDYAAPVNDGHYTCPPGVEQRWVPGYFLGNRFVYDRLSKTGMLIKQQFIDARPFFTAVERYASEDFVDYMSVRIDEYLNKIF